MEGTNGVLKLIFNAESCVISKSSAWLTSAPVDQQPAAANTLMSLIHIVFVPSSGELCVFVFTAGILPYNLFCRHLKVIGCLHFHQVFLFFLFIHCLT